MGKLDTSDLINYVLSDCPEELERAISEQIARDRNVAAKVELMRTFLSDSLPSPGPPTIAAAPRKRSRWEVLKSPRKIIAATALIALIGSVTWAGYHFLRPQPLLQDDFNDEWFDSRLWKVGQRGVREMNGYLRLMNRGSVITQQEFPEAISVSFKWKWIDHAEDPLYAEELVVVLRTAGVHSTERPFEMKDGILVRFNTWNGRVAIHKGVTEHAKALAALPKGGIPLPADSWHDIRVTDDGETVSVYIAGKAIDPKFATTPVLRAQCKGYRPGGHVAFYNREVVAQAIHESWIDDVVIRALDVK